MTKNGPIHCVKSVQIQSFFWSVFTCIESKCGQLRNRKKYLNTFHAVIMYSIITDTQLGLELSSILNGTDILQGIFYAIGKIVSLIKPIFITK